MTSNKPWDIYSEQLMPLGYGVPLWAPDQPQGRGIHIGDVGYMKEGEFFPLFNALEDRQDAQPHRATPVDFAPLARDGLVITPPREKIRQRMLCSGTTHESTLSLGGKGGKPGVASVGVQLSFTCRNNAGAILIPHPSVEAHDMQSLLRVEEYMTLNFQTWLDFANAALGIGLEPGDLHFVVGTKKTQRWMVAAFRGEYFRNKSGSLTASIGPDAGSLNMTMSIANGNLEQKYYRHGPPGRIAEHVEEMFTMPTKADASPRATIARLQAQDAPAQPAAKENAEFDQCLFINTYRFKMKQTAFSAFYIPPQTPYELTPTPAPDSRGRSWPRPEINIRSQIPQSQHVSAGSKALSNTEPLIGENNGGCFSGIKSFLRWCSGARSGRDSEPAELVNTPSDPEVSGPPARLPERAGIPGKSASTRSGVSLELAPFTLPPLERSGTSSEAESSGNIRLAHLAPSATQDGVAEDARPVDHESIYEEYDEQTALAMYNIVVKREMRSEYDGDEPPDARPATPLEARPSGVALPSHPERPASGTTPDPGETGIPASGGRRTDTPHDIRSIPGRLPATIQGEATDPVAALQDYILQNSNATIAIASDLTLYALLGDTWPKDLETAFVRIQPQIVVNERGVGRIVCDSPKSP